MFWSKNTNTSEKPNDTFNKHEILKSEEEINDIFFNIDTKVYKTLSRRPDQTGMSHNQKRLFKILYDNLMSS